MASPVAGVGGSRKKMGRNNNNSNNNKNKGVRRSSEEGSRFWMKLKLWLSCMALGGSKAEEGSTSGGNRNNKHGRKSTYGKAKDIEVDPISSTSSSRTNRSPPPNLTINHYAHLQQFTFNELRLATRNFRPENFLGEGGFGTVFKGWVSHNGSSPSRPGVGLPVAVKTLNREGLQGHKEWVNEVNHLGALQHPNLVKLVGYCIEDEQRVLVYEFMPRGSLEHHLFRSNTRGMSLPWNIRMKIMLGAARGLAFLHEEARKPLIFRDFKTSNILLDMDFIAKLSDFGLAKDAPVGDMTHVSTRVMGTQGYAAPEYVLTGHLNSKSDVYSFGVVLLEMLTGRRAMDKKRPQKEQNLVEWVKPQMRNIGASGGAAIYNMMDPMLQGKYSARGAYKAMRLATQCCSRDQKSRPLMSEVVNVLKSLPEYKHMPYSSNNNSPSPSPPPSLHGLHVGPFSSNNSSSSSHGHGHQNKYGLKVGSPSGSVASASSSRNTPTRFQASPLNYTPPFLSPKPRGGKN